MLNFGFAKVFEATTGRTPPYIDAITQMVVQMTILALARIEILNVPVAGQTFNAQTLLGITSRCCMRADYKTGFNPQLDASDPLHCLLLDQLSLL